MVSTQSSRYGPDVAGKGIYVAEVPSLPGCISQGNTRFELLANIQEAIALYLESLEAHNEPIPPPISEELVEVEL
ncbi:MAG: type II toxin-antitoxin system HicB family antitoxin [Microcystis panniformis]